VHNLRKKVERINIVSFSSFEEPLAPFTTYRVGGPAEVLSRPRSTDEVLDVLRFAHAEHIPIFVLGGGANILVSDRGIRGIVLTTTALSSIEVDGVHLIADAGVPMSDASLAAAEAGLAGLAFIYSMPGSVGGAIWMNARCYGSSIVDVLDWVDYVDADSAGEKLRVERLIPGPGDFEYKVSPFQARRTVILRASFRLTAGNRGEIFAEMEANRADRERKGHFIAPSAGSVFKNNRAFGEPSGRLIDSVGLKGFRIGGAEVSKLHANMVVNAGGATAAEIDAVIRHVADVVEKKLGFRLDREVISVGQW
jgi:UDP-N-acetylmuramate dehydrogenase